MFHVGVGYTTAKLDLRRIWVADECSTRQDGGVVVACVVTAGPSLGFFDGVFVLLTKGTTVWR